MRRRKAISPIQWIIILAIEVAGCIGLSAVFWKVFVEPQPPDFSALFATPERPGVTPSSTTAAAVQPSAPASPTATALPAILEATATLLPSPTPTPPLSAQVSDNGIGLNMRAGPGPTYPVIARLLPLTPLTLTGRTADNTWLLGTAATGDTGWVAAEFVTLSGSLEAIPVTTATVSPENPGKAANAAPTAAQTPIPPSPIDTGDYPYISGITEHAREIFLAGQQLGNRPNVFSKVGDSITANDNFLIPIGRGDYNLADYAYLQPVIDYFSAPARHGNSFVTDSLAAGPGWSSWTAINLHAADEGFCLPDEIPIACELRMVKPALALIMLGTNDIPDADAISPAVYERQMRQSIETCLNAGVIPVVSTLPAFHRDTGYRAAIFNTILFKLTEEYDIPLWNYAAAMQILPNEGLSSDGVHPSVAPAPASSTDFSPESLKYGMNVRNLTALQALDAIWREIIIK